MGSSLPDYVIAGQLPGWDNGGRYRSLGPEGLLILYEYEDGYYRYYRLLLVLVLSIRTHTVLYSNIPYSYEHMHIERNVHLPKHQLRPCMSMYH